MKFVQALHDENARFESVKRELEEVMKNAQREHWKVQSASKEAMIEQIRGFARDHYIGEIIEEHGSRYWPGGLSRIGRYFTTNGEPTNLYLIFVDTADNRYAEPVPTFTYDIFSGICFEEKDSTALEMLVRAVKEGKISVNRENGTISKDASDTSRKNDRIEDITDALFSFTVGTRFEKKGDYLYQYVNSERRDFLSRIPIRELNLDRNEHYALVDMLRRCQK